MLCALAPLRKAGEPRGEEVAASDGPEEESAQPPELLAEHDEQWRLIAVADGSGAKVVGQGADGMQEERD